MTWIEHHEKSERLAADAELAELRGDRALAVNLYDKAAQAERQALADLDHSKRRTLGITAVSAASLYLKAGKLETAETIALDCLRQCNLPEFAISELRLIIQSIWTESVRARAGLHFVPGEILVSVKGGEVVAGGAPLDIVLEKVQTVQALFYRTAEWLRGVPHRRKGPPAQEIAEICRPWLFQSLPGSYQFAIAVQQPRQLDMFRNDTPPDEFARRVLEVVSAAAHDPEGALSTMMPDPFYQAAILRLTRNLTPVGRSYSSLEMRSVSQQASVSLLPDQRETINHALKRYARLAELPENSHETLHGVLRALHLDKDWLELQTDGIPIKVHDLSDALDDVIGPMVNHRVKVQVKRRPRGKWRFVDMELDE